ncbi:MAG TPA: double-strand break repair helicase AddA [Caulobacteraceae bacterium]
MTARLEPQIAASDPRASVFVAANAGAGKTSTLVRRVARLLLAGARPETILCVTYTKAAAAEMQRRLFDQLGRWAVMKDGLLTVALAQIDEADRALRDARALFARALETSGGLKIQTIHAFCDALLRRFPLEAGVRPGFSVLEDAAAARVSAKAREDVARVALEDGDGPIGAAYAHFSVELDWRSFNAMFANFEARRAAIERYVDDRDSRDGYVRDIWRRCGFVVPTTPQAIEAEAVGKVRWGQWRRAAQALAQSDGATDQALGAQMLAVMQGAPFADVWGIFCTKAGTPRARLGGGSVDPASREWLANEQARLADACERRRAAIVARDTVHAITLARAYAAIYEGAKSARGELDFGDLIAGAHRLLTVQADAAWVLYKLDGGIDHILLDEAQDTAPGQWTVLRTLASEFFAGAGAKPGTRTMFAVADEKQSIFSFQGAAPERFAVERHGFREMAVGAEARFEEIPLLESWRSRPEVLTFVDQVARDDAVLTGLRPAPGPNVKRTPIEHRAQRAAGGCVDLWPLEVSEPALEPDAWEAPVDQPSTQSATRKLASRIARSVKAMVDRGEAVGVRGTDEMRPCAFGDVLILVRRRNALFHEIIRALKREGAPVGGADRLKLSDHVVFADLMALGQFARFPSDDLSLAALLRSPFCDLTEKDLFDLAWRRDGALWTVLRRRRAERPAWEAAAAFLGWARTESAARPPFDFFSRALNRLDPSARSMRQRMLTRLGAEAEDALDAFLAQALGAEGGGARDLESFLGEMAATEIEVKREQDDAAEGSGEVRVMTVHGAKGLEAPVVILPDTSSRATDRGGPLLNAGDGAFLWAPRKADDCAASAEARRERELAVDHESARLLYVAMTRARDRLILCGVGRLDKDGAIAGGPLFERSWYDVFQRAFASVETHAFALDDGGEGRRYGVDPEPARAAEGAPDTIIAPPAWVLGLAPAETLLARVASPSTMGEVDKGPSPSPLAAVGGLGRYRRGEIIHGLLQVLPDVDPDRRANAASSLLDRERDLTNDQRAEMARAAMAVLEDPRFAAVFGPGSKAEVAIAGSAVGLPPGLAISGRVDRLLVEPARVLVIDFKTNRPSPERIEDADQAYIRQMAFYWAVLGEIFPGRRIEAALVWTDGPKLMEVPEKLMVASLDALAQIG